MKPRDRYIHDVMANVFALADERDRFAADLRAHFDAAEAAGDPQRRVIDELGAPVDVAAAFNAERTMVFGGFWARLVAFIGDLGIMALCSLPAVALVVLWSAQFPDGEPGPADLVALLPLILLGCALVGLTVFYFPLLEWRFGKTPGKHLLGLRVVRETGTAVGLGHAFVRRLSLYFELLVIDALFIPFTDRKQRALDIIAKTVVAREPGRTIGWGGWALCLLLPLVAALGLAAIVALFASV